MNKPIKQSKTKKDTMKNTIQFRVSDEENEIFNLEKDKKGLNASKLAKEIIFKELTPSTSYSSQYQLDISKKVTINKITTKINNTKGLSKSLKEKLIKELTK